MRSPSLIRIVFCYCIVHCSCTHWTNQYCITQQAHYNESCSQSKSTINTYTWYTWAAYVLHAWRINLYEPTLVCEILIVMQWSLAFFALWQLFFVDLLVICPAGVVWLNTWSTPVVMVCLERPLLPLIGSQLQGLPAWYRTQMFGSLQPSKPWWVVFMQLLYIAKPINKLRSIYVAY